MTPWNLFSLYIFGFVPAELEDSRYDLSKTNFAQMRKAFKNFDWSYLHEASIKQCWKIMKTRICESMNGNVP